MVVVCQVVWERNHEILDEKLCTHKLCCTYMQCALSFAEVSFSSDLYMVISEKNCHWPTDEKCNQLLVSTNDSYPLIPPLIPSVLFCRKHSLFASLLPCFLCNSHCALLFAVNVQFLIFIRLLIPLLYPSLYDKLPSLEKMQILDQVELKKPLLFSSLKLTPKLTIKLMDLLTSEVCLLYVSKWLDFVRLYYLWCFYFFVLSSSCPRAIILKLQKMVWREWTWMAHLSPSARRFQVAIAPETYN